MKTLIKTLAALAVATMLTTAFAQSAKDIRGASPYVAIENEPSPKLIVDPPLPEGLPLGVFWAQYRVENLHIAPVFGAGALQVSPRVGHLHVQVDDLWWWADASDSNTIDIANLAPGEHKVRVVLVDANHNPFPGQEVTLRFTIPENAGTNPKKTNPKVTTVSMPSVDKPKSQQGTDKDNDKPRKQQIEQQYKEWLHSLQGVYGG